MKILFSAVIVFFLSMFSFQSKNEQQPKNNTSLVASTKDSLKLKVNFDTLSPQDSIRNHVFRRELFKSNVIASYYANKFNGRKTASGEIFDNKKLTAAHRKLPFGTVLKVINNENGKFVFVTVNDRGPYSKGKEIDLSRAAFFTIAEKGSGQGHLKVNIEIIEFIEY